MKEEYTISPELISVKQACDISGYTRTHIHYLVSDDTIRSLNVADSFLVVSQPDLEEYLTKQGREILHAFTPLRAAAPTAAEEETP